MSLLAFKYENKNTSKIWRVCQRHFTMTYGWLMPTETKDDLWACRQLFFLLLKSEIWMDTKIKTHLWWKTQVLKYAQLN